MTMDKFSWGAIIIAAIIEAFIVYAYAVNINEQNETTLLIATALPVVLVGTVLLFHWLQRGET
jgi:hypothetical protein